jgi:hypothetical protein
MDGFCHCDVFSFAQCLHGSFAVAASSTVGSLFTVFIQPHVKVCLQFLQLAVGFFTKDDIVECLLYGAMDKSQELPTYP